MISIRKQETIYCAIDAELSRVLAELPRNSGVSFIVPLFDFRVDEEFCRRRLMQYTTPTIIPIMIRRNTIVGMILDLVDPF